MQAKKQYSYQRKFKGNFFFGYSPVVERQEIIKTQSVGTIKMGKPKVYKLRSRGNNATSSWGVASNSRTGWKKRYSRGIGSSGLKFYPF